jgi:branched-subunit amino acid ABC-type transport system permease component
MIQVSKNKLKQDGILFIVWGWALFFVSLSGYIGRSFVLTFTLENILKIFEIVPPLLAVIFTIYYIIKQRKKVQTYIGNSLRYVWISLFVSMVLVNLIQFNVLKSINFELQHPIIMVLMAFAVTVTGGILRYRLIIIGGVAFGLLALIASHLKLQEQLLVESVAWIISFIVPGHILYANREK